MPVLALLLALSSFAQDSNLSPDQHWAPSIRTSRLAVLQANTPPARIAAQIDLMFLYLRLQNHADASRLLADIRQAWPLLPPGPVASRAFASIGVATWQLGDPAAATPILQQAIVELQPLLPPDELDAYRLVLVGIFLERKAWRDVQHWLSSVQSPAAQGSANYQYSYARLHAALQHNAEAESAFVASLAAPDFPSLAPAERGTIYQAYAKLLDKMKCKPEARAFHQKAQHCASEVESHLDTRNQVAWQSLR